MTAPENSSTPTPPLTPPSAASVWEDFVDIFHDPRAVFERRRHAGFGVPLVILVVAIGLVFILARPALQPVFDAEFARASAMAIEQSPQAAEQIQQGRAFFEKTQYFLIPFGTLLSVFGIAFTLWVVVKLFDLSLEFKAASVIATYAYAPRILEQVATLLQGFVIPAESMTSRYSLSVGFARFFDPDTASPIVLAVLGRVDVFTIWVTVLLAIGVAVMCRADRKIATMVGVTMWVLGGLPQLFSALQAA